VSAIDLADHLDVVHTRRVLECLVAVLPQWKPVGGFAEQLYAIRPYTAHVPRAVTAFVGYLRQVFAAGFGDGLADAD
jgi:hypothetical protein